MKNRLCALMLAALMLTTLVGCSSARAASQPPVQASGTQQTTAPATTELTAAEAEAIALKHAGLTADQVTRMRTEYEIDDGVPQYDVQFYRDGVEYEFEIHAKTGAIISFDKDRD